METINCEKCGCEMSKMSEACPMCGTLTIQLKTSVNELEKEIISEVDLEPKIECIEPNVLSEPLNNDEAKRADINETQTDSFMRLPDVLVYPSLLEIFTNYVAQAKKSPQGSVFIYEDGTAYCDSEFFGDTCGLGSRISYTNRPNLNFFINLKDSDELERFEKLANAKLYEKKGTYISIECGNDAEKCSYLFSEMMQKVLLITGEIDFNYYYQQNYEDVILYLNDNPEAHSSISQKIKEYNTEAKLNKYPLMIFNESERIFKGSLPSYLSKGGALSKSHKTFKKMKQKFEEIVEICSQNLSY